MRFARSLLILVAVLGLGSCSLVVDFDRSLLPDGGVEGGIDAGADGAVDGGEDAAVDGGASAG